MRPVADMAHLLEDDRFAHALGVELVEARPDRVVVEIEIREAHYDASARLSSGVMFSLADCAMSLISNAQATAVAVATHFVPAGAPRDARRLRAVAVPQLPRDGRPATWQVTVGADGRTVATFTGTTLQRR